MVRRDPHWRRVTTQGVRAGVRRAGRDGVRTIMWLQTLAGVEEAASWRDEGDLQSQVAHDAAG